MKFCDVSKFLILHLIGYEKQIQPRITPMQTTIERSEIDDIIEVELEAEVRRQRWISSASTSQSQPQKRANLDEQMIGGRDLLKKVRPEGLVFT